MGERKTPEPFIAACDKFVFFEVLKKPAEEAAAVQVPDLPNLQELMTHAVQETARYSGWSRLSEVGSLIGKTHASFDARNYGFAKLSELVRKQQYLEVAEAPDHTGFVHLQVRLK